MKILITGAAGFIGYHLSNKLLAENHEVIGVDSINDYYDVNLKQSRLKNLEASEGFKFIKADIADLNSVQEIFKQNVFDIIVHLAAQAGVRYSIENPFAYLQSNVIGQMNILESIRNIKPDLKHFIYASSSSVYGNSDDVPFSEIQKTDEPVSLYAATKKSAENITHSYTKLYGIKTTGLRFFTVYGEYGRPDMAYFSFTKNILEGKTIKLFNNGNLQRDFTYIDDIIDGISKIVNTEPKANFKIYNIGNNKPVELKYFLQVLEDNIGKKANVELLAMQKGDVYKTYADISEINKDYSFEPKTNIEKGLRKFVDWYKEYY